MLTGRMFNFWQAEKYPLFPNVHVLNPELWESVTLQGKRDFTVKDLEMGRLS